MKHELPRCTGKIASNDTVWRCGGSLRLRAKPQYGTLTKLENYTQTALARWFFPRIHKAMVKEQHQQSVFLAPKALYNGLSFFLLHTSGSCRHVRSCPPHWELRLAQGHSGRVGGDLYQKPFDRIFSEGRLKLRFVQKIWDLLPP